MAPSQRLVLRIPLTELWDFNGERKDTKLRNLVGNDIVAMLQRGAVRFVVADCGHPLRWIPTSESMEFWKHELKARIVDTETFNLAEFPGDYCYIASEWSDGQPIPIVLFEKNH